MERPQRARSGTVTARKGLARREFPPGGLAKVSARPCSRPGPGSAPYASQYAATPLPTSPTTTFMRRARTTALSRKSPGTLVRTTWCSGNPNPTGVSVLGTADQLGRMHAYTGSTGGPDREGSFGGAFAISGAWSRWVEPHRIVGIISARTKVPPATMAGVSQNRLNTSGPNSRPVRRRMLATRIRLLG